MELIKPPLPSETSRESIGGRIRLTRSALDMSPTEVCGELGIRRSTWSMNEAGKSLPNVYDMIRFCERYGVTLEWIYRGNMAGMPHELALKISVKARKSHVST